MGTTYGVLIAVEKYQDSRIKPVRYAENDANGLRDALAIHGLDAAHTVRLTSAEATKTRIESEVRRVCKVLKSGDTLFFYYAGHGFSKDDKNFITCHDTVKSDLALTSIELQSLLKQLKKSACRKLVLFLDSCHSGLDIDDGMRSILSHLSDDEFKEFCHSAEHHHAFAACKPDEQSHSALYLKHGIWTYHLLEALSGRDKQALERGSFLTASSLEAYLSESVSKSTHLPTGTMQTPMSWGSKTREFIIADFTTLFATQDAEARAQLGDLKQVSLQGRFVEWIKKLSGFKRSHRVPDAVNNQTRSFVRSIATNEIQQRVDEISESLKRSFQYKRRDLKIDLDGLIETPDFTVEVSVDFDADDSDKCVISTTVLDIKNPAAVASEAFAEVFDGEFDQLCFEVSGQIDVAALIDKVEDDPRGMEINYPGSAKSCTITAPGLATASIEVRSNQVAIQFRSTQEVQVLLGASQSFARLAASSGGVLGTALRLL